MTSKISESNSDPANWRAETEKCGDTTYQYSASWIKSIESEDHWRLYWKQQDLLKTFLQPNETVMEIGVGSGFAANYLRSKGHAVTTFDIDAEKQPDIVGNLVTHEFDGSFDHILAFEVFEHIPYQEFVGALGKVRRWCKKSLCLSVPIAEREVAFAEFKLPRIKKKRLALKLPKRSLWEYHFWEIGYRDTSEKRFLDDLAAYGFKPEIVEKKMMRLFVGCQCV